MRRIKMLQRVAAAAVVAGAVFVGYWLVSGVIGSEVAYESSPVVYATEVGNTPDKIEALKDDIVDRLAECESNNAPQERALIVYDNNSRGTLAARDVPSIGVMQFKVSTVQMFWKTLHGTDLSNYEATLLALDNDRAKALAREAIIGIKGALWHWSCGTQDMATRVMIIRELE